MWTLPEIVRFLRSQVTNEQATEDEPLSIPIQLSSDMIMIMFKQVSQSLTDSKKFDLIDIITTIKHRIYEY